MGSVSESSDDGSVIDRGRYREMTAKQHEWALVSQDLDARVSAAEQAVKAATILTEKQSAELRSLSFAFEQQVRLFNKLQDDLGSVEQLKILKKQARAKSLQSNLDSVTAGNSDGGASKRALLHHIKELTDALASVKQDLERTGAQASKVAAEKQQLQGLLLVGKNTTDAIKSKCTELAQRVQLLEQEAAKALEFTKSLEKELQSARAESSKAAEKHAALLEKTRQQLETAREETQQLRRATDEQARLDQSHASAKAAALAAQVKDLEQKLTEARQLVELERSKRASVEENAAKEQIRIRSELNAVVEDLTARLSAVSCIASTRDEEAAREQENKMEAALASLKAEHAAALSAVSKQTADAARELKNQADSALARLRAEHEAALAEAAREHKNETEAVLTSLRAEHADAVAAMAKQQSEAAARETQLLAALHQARQQSKRNLQAVELAAMAAWLK